MTKQVTAARPDLDIAIVSMAGRFPGAPDVATLWRNLCAGVESIAHLSDDDLRSAGVDEALSSRPNYVRARAILEGVQWFDADLFGFTPREAARQDPQHRLFLESCWTALEQGGYDPDRIDGRVGVFGGSSLSGYLFHVFPQGLQLASAQDLSALIGLDKDFLTTLVSYKLNLQGPSIAVQTACSTSLVAVHLACQALLAGECELALAGGVSLTLPQHAGYLYQEGAIASPDGHCRVFDAKAQGTVAGSGVGVVLLKRLEDALADGDPIVALIKGSAVNNDGRDKLGYTAPRLEGQARAILEAHLAAGVDAQSIGYIEAHGTGTPLGDPIEVAALTQAFGASAQRRNFCALGSIKSNLGHLDAAAGVVGLIKAALAVSHATIPPTLHFAEPNPAMDLSHGPFFVADNLQAWSGEPRRAGVSAFGLGGTNAHVVLEEAPARAAVNHRATPELLVLSARSSQALATLSQALADHLECTPSLALADVAHTLRTGRRAFSYRRTVVASDIESAIKRLRATSGEAQTTLPRDLAFLFPGQGTHYAGMGRELYASEAIFRDHVDRCAHILRNHLAVDIRSVISDEPGEAAQQALDDTALTQPALFVVEYALARTLMAWGLQPSALLGHSVGEYVAACVAQALSLDDALRLVAARGRLMASTPAGAMLALRATPSEVSPWLSQDLALAAINGPRQCVLAGTLTAIEACERELAERGLKPQRLRNRWAFHSHLQDSILPAFAAVLQSVTWHAPRIPWVSNLTGTWITPSEFNDPRYWVAHLRHTVQFARGVQTLQQTKNYACVEVGPGATLSRLYLQWRVQDNEAAAIATDRTPFVGATLPDTYGPDARETLLNAMGHLWVDGAPLAVDALTSDSRQRVALPPTPFERQHCWLEPARLSLPNSPCTQSATAPALDEWFYVPSWRRQPALTPVEASADEHWLVLVDDEQMETHLRERLHLTGRRMTAIRPGSQWSALAHQTFVVRANEPADFVALAVALADAPPTHVVHAWSLRGDAPAPMSSDEVMAAQSQGALSLIWLARALAKSKKRCELFVVAHGLCDVIGCEALRPDHALLLGVVRTLDLEYKNICVRLLDLEEAPTSQADVTAMANHLLAHGGDKNHATLVAYRGGYRWLPHVEPVALPQVQGKPQLLRDHGVYLITGGLGGIGLHVAEYLASRVAARLVVVSRRPPGADETKKINELRARSIEVEVCQADVANLSDMQAVVDHARQRFGRIDGVIHAAGVHEGGLLERVNGQTLANEWQAKVKGTVVLDHVLRGESLDFVVFCSSLTAQSGGIGQVGYAAANAFLDAFAHLRNRSGRGYTLTVNFDRWRHVGMAIRGEARLQAAGIDGSTGMSAEQGIELFDRLLNQQQHVQLVVSSRKLDALPRDELATIAVLSSIREASASHKPTPALQALDVESQLEGIFATFLGLPRVDHHKNIFELGGDSLLALQILNRVQETFGATLSLRDFFEHPTIAQLAPLLVQDHSPNIEMEPPLVALARRPMRLRSEET